MGVRLGYAEFPKEILRPPRSLAEKTYTRIERWTPMKQGGTSPPWSSRKPSRKSQNVLQVRDEQLFY